MRSKAAKAGSRRLRSAGWLSARLPPVRGSDRAVGWVRGGRPASGRIEGRFTNDVRFAFDEVRDDAMNSLVYLQYVPPALAPVIEVALTGGSCFYDVGANIGIYSLWASTVMGATGQVHAFEPVPSTRALLDRFVRTNQATNVSVVQCAVGARPGQASIQMNVGASAQASVVSETTRGSIEVDMVSLDSYSAHHHAPDLVKVDVEGHELEVLEGSRELMRQHHPLVVLEAIPAHLKRAGTSYVEVRRLLETYGYQLWNLTPSGLRLPTGTELPTTNVLALCADSARHRQVGDQLVATRFARNQTV